MPCVLVGCPELADGGQPEAMPERPELGGRPPGPLVVCKKEVCAAWRRGLSCDGCPSGRKPVPYGRCQGAGHEDVGERGIMICAVRMRAAVACCICSMDVPREGPDEELPV